MREIALRQLECRETEDWVGSDDVQLEVTVDGNDTFKLRRRMTDGDRWRMNKRYRFSDSVNLRLIERDSADPNDVLGEHKISSADTGTARHRFSGDDADYRLRYRVDDVPGPENSGDPQQLAYDLIVDFSRGDGSGAWPHITRSDLAHAMRERVQRPAGMQQGRAQLCGPAAINFKLAQRDPEVFVQMCISLWEQGRAPLRDGTYIEPSSDTVNSRVARRTTAADWIINASLRDAANVLLDVERDDQSSVHAKAAGMTTPWEMVEWCKKVLGLPNADYESAYIYGEEDAIQSAHRAVRQGGVGFMMIDGEMLKSGDPNDIGDPDHWATYEGRLSIDEGLWYAWDSGHYRFRAWSWGRYYRSVSVSEGNFEDWFWGAVTATP